MDSHFQQLCHPQPYLHQSIKIMTHICHWMVIFEDLFHQHSQFIFQVLTLVLQLKLILPTQKSCPLLTVITLSSIILGIWFLKMCNSDKHC